VRILLISNMYPSVERPDYGVFVERLGDALAALGHTVDPVVLRASPAGRLRTPAKYADLLLRGLAGGHRRPDVIYAHYLVPTGAIARIVASRADIPYVLTAHGTDVENAAAGRATAAATRWAIARAAAVIAVSRYLAGRIEVPAGVPLEVIDCGVDTERLLPAPRAPGGEDGPRFLFVGSLIARKNVERLLEAFSRLERGTLTVVGGGPLEARLRTLANDRVRIAGRLDSDGVAVELGRADVVCQPSLEEAQGQVVLEALACGRPVVATRNGGPAELVTDGCGVLIDPLDVTAIADGMRRAATLPVPCPAAVKVAAGHDLRLQAARVEQVLRSAAGGSRGAAPSKRE